MTVIKIKNSNVAGRVPAAGDLEVAELGINLQDKKLYSKDASGSIFEIGAAGDLPSGDVPPGSGNNVGDLFYNTKVGEEGLYYWDGSSWVLLTSEPADGEGYVRVSGDNMTGALTIGPADQGAARAISLNEDGSSRFNGEIFTASPVVIGDGEDFNIGVNSNQRTAELGIRKNAGNSNAAAYVKLPQTGANERYLYFDNAANLRTSNSRDDIGSENGELISNQTVDNTGYVHVSGDNMTGALTIGPDVGPAVTTLADDGSATFAGLLKAEVPNSHSHYLGSDGVGIYTLATSDNKKLILARSDHGGGAVEQFIVYSNGDAYFRGNASLAGPKGIIFHLEPDNPANYTTTMVDGVEQQVYSGPTLDVKEKLMEALATIEDLKTRIAALEA